MSEERKMILQMLADGKISAGEADHLLEAIEESERAAEESVVESAQKSDRTADGLQSLGRIVDSAVRDAYSALDETFRSLEKRLEHDEARQEQLKRRVEERIRTSTERALERALQAEERAARVAERAAQRMQEQAERFARRQAGREERVTERGEGDTGRAPKSHFFKMGLHIDKQAVKRVDDLSIAAMPGDRFSLDNRVGDIQVEFYDGDQIEVEARKTVWGSDETEANQRADATQLQLVRSGSEVKLEVARPTFIITLGYMQIKDTRIDFTVRLPRKTGLQAMVKVGDIRVEGGGEITAWDLQTKVGDVELTLPEDLNFTYRLKARLGKIDIALDETLAGATESRDQGVITGACGEGGGQINVQVETGDIRLHH